MGRPAKDPEATIDDFFTPDELEQFRRTVVEWLGEKPTKLTGQDAMADWLEREVAYKVQLNGALTSGEKPVPLSLFARALKDFTALAERVLSILENHERRA